MELIVEGEVPHDPTNGSTEQGLSSLEEWIDVIRNTVAMMMQKKKYKNTQIVYKVMLMNRWHWIKSIWSYSMIKDGTQIKADGKVFIEESQYKQIEIKAGQLWDRRLSREVMPLPEAFSWQNGHLMKTNCWQKCSHILLSLFHWAELDRNIASESVLITSSPPQPEGMREKNNRWPLAPKIFEQYLLFPVQYHMQYSSFYLLCNSFL